ncbi:hypothetical protein F8A10_12090 [Paracoccus kondratievae]|uniref:hypothetical protein n=1 Tax=Paracoccus kondratievae TaxID=135740 RepID=UPI0012660907|nr:hypothetical protein [Paracoccus kondratievae]QFQ88250.1 hypothetical protein F8A10_12090 [Paracoccus kondratievae]
MNARADLPKDAWIDELERDLGRAAALRLLANAGGQRRDIPKRAEGSVLAAEVGTDVVTWLACRFAGTTLDIPSPWGRERQDRANALRAAILDAGLTDPRRSANVIATEFGVSAKHVHNLRAKMRKEYGMVPYLPLFDQRD